jgi:hypothetical protein
MTLAPQKFARSRAFHTLNLSLDHDQLSSQSHDCQGIPLDTSVRKIANVSIALLHKFDRRLYSFRDPLLFRRPFGGPISEWSHTGLRLVEVSETREVWTFSLKMWIVY